MKIGIIGNMNNAYFSLCRYLRDAGYDCHLLIYKNEPDHFDPSCDTVTGDYFNYIKKVDWGEPSQFLSEDFEKVKNHQDIHLIGYIHEKKDVNVMITKQGNVVHFTPQGWNHFTG